MLLILDYIRRNLPRKYSKRKYSKNSEPCSLFLRQAIAQRRLKKSGKPVSTRRAYVRRTQVKRYRLTWVLLISAFLQGCDTQPEISNYTGPTMGTEYRVTVVDRDRIQVGPSLVRAKIESALERVNQSMSTYIPDSEISRFNRLAAGQAQTLSDDMWQVTSEALELGEFTNGAFDPTLGKAIRLWGFAEDGRISEQPSAETLMQIRDSVGYQKIELSERRLAKQVNGLELNLSAIAKGYAVDLVAQELELLGLNHYLVNIGGELRAKGQNADNVTWRVGVEKPQLLGGVKQVVMLKDQAIATSGDYRNYIVIDGQQFSHTIDSTTLKPIYHKLASVSVVSDKASTADALATALLAMGEERGVAFAHANNIAAYFIIRRDAEDEFTVHVTEKFRVNLPQ